MVENLEFSKRRDKEKLEPNRGGKSFSKVLSNSSKLHLCSSFVSTSLIRSPSSFPTPKGENLHG